MSEVETGFDLAPAIVALTQSGSTASVLRLLREGGAAGAFRVVVTNTPGSAATALAELSVVTPAGAERAVPATRSFTAALVALLVLGREWAGASVPRAPAGGPALVEAAGAAPELLEAALALEHRVAGFVTPARARGPWFFLGGAGLRGLGREGALKMTETAVVPAIELPAGELAHGPAALLRATTPVVVVSKDAAPRPAEARSLAAARTAGAPVLRIAPAVRDCARRAGLETGAPAGVVPRGADSLHCDSGVGRGTAPDLELSHPEAKSLPAMAFFAAPVLQFLALYAGRQLGRDVDRPPGLVKAVGDD